MVPVFERGVYVPVVPAVKSVPSSVYIPAGQGLSIYEVAESEK